MPLKKYQNPKGGLNEAGRKHFESKEGGNLQAPVKSGTNPRRVSFAPAKTMSVLPSVAAVLLVVWVRLLLKSRSSVIVKDQR